MVRFFLVLSICSIATCSNNKKKIYVCLFVFEEPTRIAGSDETPHIVVNVGDEIDLICDASGVPEPVLGWVKNGDEPLLDISRVLNQGRRMFVERAQVRFSF